MMKTDVLTITKRIEIIISQITAFSKEKYFKEELLEELLKLQAELVELVYNDEHAKQAELRIWNVIKQLELLNKQRGDKYSEEVEKVINQLKYIGNLISAEVSGIKGEKKTFHNLLNMNCKKIIKQNVEFKDDIITTELDDVVITRKGVFVVEVKNTQKDIFIDEAGNYYRDSEYGRLDCNIGEKMNYKERLLKNALSGLNKNIKIHSILVFTNSNIQVRNTYKYIRHCFLGQLPHIIEDYEGECIFSNEDMEEIADAIEEGRTHTEYPFEIDFVEFKKEFATLLAKLELEETGEVAETEITEEKSVNDEKVNAGNYAYICVSVMGMVMSAAVAFMLGRKSK